MLEQETKAKQNRTNYSSGLMRSPTLLGPIISARFGHLVSGSLTNNT